MLKVIEVKANENYTLDVKLSNGMEGLFDVKPYMDKGVFKQLKDKGIFKNVYPQSVGIAWHTGQDLSADTIEYGLLKRH
ncbi:MAG: hypothetical protein Ctma_0234 [Catillopecten margaritatus gill symbiont]|uniref:DUF2442 domain-containing protein n=1 Tax=Catillopecten margaritatus gill symbiont TaxID=3083288 RepID=A0AAU6PET7_9GAMM